MIIGINPGSSGGIAWLVAGRAYTCKMPSTVADLLEVMPRGTAWIEQVHAMPGQGVTSMFTFGRNLGQIEGVLAALKIPHRYVSPAKWQKEFGLLRKSKAELIRDKKNRHKAEAQRLFPHIKITHAIADALLIAEYGRRQT